jgi:predicted ArsR family transcriptional regulator
LGIHPNRAQVPLNHWSKRFAESTRGRIVALLRGEPRTVEQLARAVGLTDNAVRVHLVALERDGLIEHSPLRRGGAGKPAYTYAVTENGELLLSTAYAPVLGKLLEVLEERNEPPDRERLMKAVGKRLAHGRRVPSGGPRRRLAAAVELFHDLGAVATVERSDGSAVIHSPNCPLGAVVRSHPEVCEALATAIEELVSARTTVRCDRGDGRLRCSFAVGPL